MRKRFFVFAAIIAALSFGCFLQNSPKAAVEKFAQAIEKNDMKALAEVATPDTVQLVAMFGTKMQGYLASSKVENGKVKSMAEKIDGDKATVTITYEKGKDETFDLVKVDGKWKVNISTDMTNK